MSSDYQAYPTNNINLSGISSSGLKCRIGGTELKNNLTTICM
jgi:hypothetical protein